MRTYLVTGGAGFIGSNYIHYMFQKYDNEIRIINVDKLTYAGNLENLKDIEGRDNYTFVKADICDSETIQKIFEENDIDRVVHFAAESHVDRSIKNPDVFVKTNVLGTLVMLNAAKAAWELPDGTFQRGSKSFSMYPQTRCMVSLDEDGGYFYETTPYDAPQSVLGQQGFLGYAGEGLYGHVSFPGEYHQLQQQLRALSVPGKTDSADY